MLLDRNSIMRLAIACSAAALLSGCSTVGSMMSPYSEKFDCKNSDHGQCIHPDRAYEDAVAGVTSKSDPAVTRDNNTSKDWGSKSAAGGRRGGGIDAYGSYKDSVYRELKGLIEAPVTPMLKPARTVRTLILPYVDRQRPDRLYMPRYIYSVLDRPLWVVGDMLITSPNRALSVPVLGQVRETPEQAPEISAVPAIRVDEPK